MKMKEEEQKIIMLQITRIKEMEKKHERESSLKKFQ